MLHLQKMGGFSLDGSTGKESRNSLQQAQGLATPQFSVILSVIWASTQNCGISEVLSEHTGCQAFPQQIS